MFLVVERWGSLPILLQASLLVKAKFAHGLDTPARISRRTASRRSKGKGGVCLVFVHGRSRMTIDPRKGKGVGVTRLTLEMESVGLLPCRLSLPSNLVTAHNSIQNPNVFSAIGGSTLHLINFFRSSNPYLYQSAKRPLLLSPPHSPLTPPHSSMNC